nr:anti-sigma factor C-terminal domain-containing protein [Evansella tamaricis]
MIHEGYVGDFAFSTDDYHSPEELINLLEDYDLDILWMPLYMGEYDSFSEHGYSGGGNSMSLHQQWGLSGAREVSEDYMGGSLIRVLDGGSVEESKEAMLQNMDFLLKNHKKNAEQLLGTQYLQERYDYLHSNGFQVYGAVVTGPVKELLKLREQEGIHSFYLGEFKPWNWSQ